MTALTSLSGSSAYQYYTQSLLTSGSGSTSASSETSGTKKTSNENGLAAIFDSMSLQSSSSSGETTSVSDSSLSTDSVLSSNTLQALLDQMQTSQTSESDSLADMISSMDTDSDGTITQEEFVAARPDDVTEDMATSLWNQFDTEGAGSLSTDDLETARTSSPPAGGGGSVGGSEESSDSTSYSSLDTNEDGVVSLNELLAAQSDGVDVSAYGLEESAASEPASASAASATTSTLQSVQNQFLEAMNAYQSSAAFGTSSMNLSQMMELV